MNVKWNRSLRPFFFNRMYFFLIIESNNFFRLNWCDFFCTKKNVVFFQLELCLLSLNLFEKKTEEWNVVEETWYWIALCLGYSCVRHRVCFRTCAPNAYFSATTNIFLPDHYHQRPFSKSQKVKEVGRLEYIYIYIYISATASVMQSSSKELSTLVADRV